MLNNDPDMVRRQVKQGIDAVIVDSVLKIRKGLTEDAEKPRGRNEAGHTAPTQINGKVKAELSSALKGLDGSTENLAMPAVMEPETIDGQGQDGIAFEQSNGKLAVPSR